MLNQTQKQALLQRNKARICDLLKWSVEEYNVFVWNSGLRYLSLYIGKDQSAIINLETRKVFWNWWINLWNFRDESFVDEFDGLEDSLSTDRLLKTYHQVHSPELLVAEIHPPRIVFGDSFTIIQLTDEKN